MLDLSNYNVYQCKDGRIRAYNKVTHAVVSYPRLLMENLLGRSLDKTEDVHHVDENPLNNDIKNLEVIDHKKHDAMHGGKNRKYFPIKKKCPVCGEEFIWTERRQSRYHSKKQLNGPYCSKRCAGKITGPMANRKTG